MQRRIVLFVSLALCNAVVAQYPCGDICSDVFTIVNQERAANGQPPLCLNSQLMAAAQKHSEYQTSIATMTHDGPGNNDVGDRVTAEGYTWNTVGENVAFNQATPAAVMNAWMNSAGHRANILNGNYRNIGIGYTSSRYWTQVFARRADGDSGCDVTIATSPEGFLGSTSDKEEHTIAASVLVPVTIVGLIVALFLLRDRATRVTKGWAQGMSVGRARVLSYVHFFFAFCVFVCLVTAPGLAAWSVVKSSASNADTEVGPWVTCTGSTCKNTVESCGECPNKRSLESVQILSLVQVFTALAGALVAFFHSFQAKLPAKYVPRASFIRPVVAAWIHALTTILAFTCMCLWAAYQNDSLNGGVLEASAGPVLLMVMAVWFCTLPLALLCVVLHWRGQSGGTAAAAQPKWGTTRTNSSRPIMGHA